MQIATSIEKCFKKRYGNTISETKEAAVNVNADEGGHLLLDVSRILNCNVWSDSTEIAQYTNHLSDFRQYFDCFKIQGRKRKFSSYNFSTNTANHIDLWGKFLTLQKDDQLMKPFLLIDEIFLCTVSQCNIGEAI